MKVAIYGRHLKHEFTNYLIELISVLQDNNVEIIIYEPFNAFLKNNYILKYNFPTFNDYSNLNKNIDFLFSVGGDGTLLNTISLVKDSDIFIVGINIGKLGFLSSISKEDINNAVINIINGKFTLEERSLLNIEASDYSFGEFNYALNDITIHKKESSTMIHIQAYINDEYLNSYWADGLIIATPTGSTGYSLSCGGPIITPDSQNFVITPIATHNLTVRPIVIPDNYTIKLKVSAETDYFFVTLDSRTHSVSSVSEIIISKQNFKIKLARIYGNSFFSTIRTKLMWGHDIRN